jgi:hypothetical protein
LSTIINSIVKQKRRNIGKYEKYVRCNGCIVGKWVLRSSLRAGQVRCDDCNQLFRTGPKDTEWKERYDEALRRY